MEVCSFVCTSNAAQQTILSYSSTPTGNVSIQNNSGTLRTLLTGYINVESTVIGKTYTFVRTYSDISPYPNRWWVNGRLIDSNTSYTFPSQNTYIGNGFAGGFSNGAVLFYALIQGAATNVSDAFAQSVSVNPWQLFAPEYDIAVTSAGGTNTPVDPGVGNIVITGYAPAVDQTRSAEPGVGNITITGYAPTVSQGLFASPGVGNIVITGYAPGVDQTRSAEPGAGNVVITGYAPTVTQASASQNIAPDVGAIVITGYAPTVAQSSDAGQPSGGFNYGGNSAIGYPVRVRATLTDDDDTLVALAELLPLGQPQQPMLEAIAEQLDDVVPIVEILAPIEKPPVTALPEAITRLFESPAPAPLAPAPVAAPIRDLADILAAKTMTPDQLLQAIKILAREQIQRAPLTMKRSGMIRSTKV